VIGVVFAIESDRFPAAWDGRLLDLTEIPWEEGFRGTLRPHDSADREAVVMSCVRAAP
jgi:hypothetical protein